MTEPIPAEVRRPATSPWRDPGSRSCSAPGIPTQIGIGFALQAAGLEPDQADGALSRAFIFALSLVDTVVLVSLISGSCCGAANVRGRCSAAAGRWRARSAPACCRCPWCSRSSSWSACCCAIRPVAAQRARESAARHSSAPSPACAMFLSWSIVAGGVREELQRAFLLHRFRGDLGQPWMGCSSRASRSASATRCKAWMPRSSPGRSARSGASSTWSAAARSPPMVSHRSPTQRAAAGLLR